MASIVLGGIGSAIGGPVGGIVGGMLGSLIDSHLFHPKKQVGPTLSDLSVTSATFGQPIPLCYGTTRIAGNVIWSTSLVSHTNTIGGKGGGGQKQETFTYTCSFAVGICAGPITKIWRIWCDGQIIIDWRPASVYTSLASEDPQTEYNTAAPWTDYITVHLGTEDQMPDATMEAIQGVGNVPAYRGLAYIVASNFPVTTFGNRVPNFTFEVVGEVTTQPNLVYNDDFQANNEYFSGASTTAKAYAPSSVDQNGTFILTGGNGTSAGISQTGNTDWTKTSTALAAELIAAAYPSFTASSVSNPGMVAVANGQYILGFASIADIPLNATRFFVGVYTPNAGAAPTLKGAIVIGSGIYATGWPYNGTAFGWTVAGAQTTEDPIVAIGAQGIGGTAYYVGVMPSIGSIIGGSQGVQNAQNATLGLPATQGLLSLYGPITTYLPQEGAFLVPYVTEEMGFLFAASQPTIVTGTQLVLLFTKTQIANNTGGSACPLITTWGNDLHTGGAAVMYDLGVLSMPEFLPTTISVAALPSPTDYTGDLQLPWTDAGTFLTGLAPGSTDDYQPTPALMAQSGQSASGVGVLYGWVMAGDEDMSTNRANLSELAAVRIMIYDPILKVWTPWSYSIGEILSAADLGGVSSNFQNNNFCIYSSPTGAVQSGAVNDLILGGSLQGNASHDGGYTYWTALGGLDGTWGCGLDAIVLDICKRAGLSTAEVDVVPLSTQIVDGYCVTHQMPGRTAIETLQQAYFFDGVESDWIIKFKFRNGTPIGSISANDLGARQDNIEQDVTPVTEIRQGNADLPRGVVIKYMLHTIDYQTATQQAKRPLPAIFTNQLTTYDLSITMQPADAKAAAEKALYLAWLQRTSYRLVLPRTVLQYDPGDVLTLNYNDAAGNGLAVPVYMESMDFGANDTVNATGLATDAAVFTTALPASYPEPSVKRNLNLAQAIQYWLMDAPLLRDTDDTPGFYTAAAGLSNLIWQGGPLNRSLDGGATFSLLDTYIGPTFGGSAVTSLGAPPGNDYSLWDETNSLVVTMLTPFMLLNSTTPNTVLAGTENVAMLGEELIGFANVTEIGPQLYRLSLLRRGMQGSDWAMGSHTVGEPFVLLSGGNVLSETLQLSQLGLAFEYEAYSANAVTTNLTPSTMVCEGVRIKPLSPINAEFVRDGSHNLTLTWVPRRRQSDDILDGLDQYIDEPVESYQVNILPYGPPAVATFNPGNAGGQLVLSNGNLTITNTTLGTTAAASCTGPLGVSNKSLAYMEFLVAPLSAGSFGAGVGIVNGNFPYTDYLGENASSLGYGQDGSVRSNGIVLTSSLQTFGSVASIIGMALNLETATIWFRGSNGLWNNSSAADPVAGIGGIAVPPAVLSGTPGTAALNPSQATASIALSNGNLTAQETDLGNSYQGVWGNTSHNSGKFYVEFTNNGTLNANQDSVGFGDASFALTTGAASTTASSICAVGTNVNPPIYFDGANLGHSDTGGAVSGIIQCAAIDLTNNLIWFRTGSGNWNGSGAANPATGSGGFSIAGRTANWFPMIQLKWYHDEITVNLGASAFTYTAPVGFGPWQIPATSVPVIQAVFAGADIVPGTGGAAVTVNFGNSAFLSPFPESYLPWTACPGYAVRSIAASTPTASYTAAQQTTDGLTPGQPVSVNIFQISNRIGLGYPGSFTG